jgi:site-specific DNA recombinase
VYDIDRLARKSVYQALIEEEFLRLGIMVEYVIGQYDNSDEGRLQKQIRASIAEYEKAKILERSKREKRGKAQSGFVVVGSRPPYGYKTVSEPHKAWLEVDEDEATIVVNVFNWYLRGDETNGPMSMNAIAKKLTDMRIATRGDKHGHIYKKYEAGSWSAEMIRHILKNETYTGTWYYGKTKMVDDGKKREAKPKCGFGKQVPRAREEWISVPVPAIIEQEAFNSAQSRMKLNSEQSDRSRKYEYLLSKRLRCAKCGLTYQGRTRRKNNMYYYCKSTERRPIKRCDMPVFRGRDVDDTIWAWVVDLIQHPERIIAGLHDQQEEQGRSAQALSARLDLIESQMADNENQLSKLLDLYLSGGFEREMLAERRVRLEENKAGLTKEHADISSYLEQSVISDEQVEDIKSFCETIRNELDVATFEQKRQLLEMLDVRGTLAVEDNERVVYVKCLVAPQQRLSLAPTLPSSNTGETATTRCASPPTAPSR